MPPRAEPATAPLVATHDRREGGEWTALQTVKNQAIYAGARTLLLGLSPLPAPWLRALGRGLGQALHFIGLSPRRLALENLARAYPDLPLEERRTLARRAYRQLGSYLGGAVAQLLRPGRFAPIPFEEGSREVLTAALGRGDGVLFASAHLGPWEQVAGSLVHHGFPLTTIARESYDPRFVRLYETLRGRVGVRSIYRGSSTAPIQIVRTLRGGGLLGVPMDLRSRVPSVEAPFLGELASTPVGPARIALRTGASVVVGTVVPAAGPRGSSAIDPPLALRVSLVQTEDLRADAPGERTLTERLNAELSRRIRAFPEGWVWMHPRWGPASGKN